MNIAKLLKEKNNLTKRLQSLIYGSIEIREKNDKKYIYVHHRYEGILKTKYVGEYSTELYNLILENKNLAKELKRRLRIINKELTLLGYIENNISDKVKLNIDFARKNLVSSIYKQCILEGVATTYELTETIIDGGNVNNMSGVDVSKIGNLKHSWDFILSEGVIRYPTNYALICQINALVEEGFTYNAGLIRSTPVRIGNCNYITPIPFESDVKEQINSIIDENNLIGTAIKLVLYLMKKQIFLDGNKRTAILAANHYLISHGNGLIIVPDHKVEIFKHLLIDYYEKDNEQIIYDFLYNECLINLN